MVKRELYKIIRWESGSIVETQSLGVHDVPATYDPTELKRLAMRLGGDYFLRWPNKNT